MKWIPEPKPASGGLAAEGFYRLLGRPRLDPLTVLVRETAQNSWDARLENDSPVVFEIQGWHLTDSEQSALRSRVFLGADQVRGTELAKELQAEPLTGLYICDRNTKGLGGPLQADKASPDSTYDWVDFVLNVGEANTQGHTGGTYGFGKTISYVVSAANSVVVHSRTRVNGRLETRLIACAIGERFAKGKKLYTGRHWWGVPGKGVPLPVTGREADRLAKAIGMPAFEEGETGTNLLVVSPDFGGRSEIQGMRFIAESVTWHLWPKLIERGDRQCMEIAVTWNGEAVDIPSPEDRPPLHGFVQAFKALNQESSNQTAPPGLQSNEIKCLRPKVDVGVLVAVPLIYRERAEVDDGFNPEDHESPRAAAAIAGPCHHVALLRSPELVVDYLPGPAPTEGGTEWAGVFRADDAHDEYFAAAEPPTHDSWNPELLPKGRGKTIVNVGLREIGAALDGRWSPRKPTTSPDVSTTALVADELAHLVGAMEGKGKGGQRTSRPGSTGRALSRPKVVVMASAPLQLGTESGTLIRLAVTPVKSSRMTALDLRVSAALDGQGGDDTLDPELSLVEARLNDEIQSLDGHQARLQIPGTDPVEVDVIARRGSDTAVLFDFEAEALR